MLGPTHRTLVLVGLTVLIGGVTLAGDFHTGTGLICSDCHVMHYSQTHGYNPDGTGSPFVNLAGGPHTYLLRQDVNDLCLTCHDAQPWAPDVLAAQTGSVVRQAGALNRDNTGVYLNGTGHTLGSTDTPPGGSPLSGALECTSCHNPHGYGGPVASPYRNLAPMGGFPGHSVSYVVGTNDNAFDVFERTAGEYDVDNVDLNEPDTADSAIAEWCAGCHGDFHGTVGSANIDGDVATGHFIRHPAAGVDIGGIGGGHSNLGVYRIGEAGNKVNYVKVMTDAVTSTEGWPENGTQWNPTTVPTDLTPTCITCHKGHGNQNAFGLIYMADTGTVTEEGTASGMYFDLCKQCHVQGG